MMSMIDIVALAIVAGLFIIGFLRGIIRELADLIGLILGYFLAIKFSIQLAAMLPIPGAPLMLKGLIASAIIVIVSWLLVRSIASAFKKIVLSGPAKFADKIFGGLLGGAKGFLIVLILLILMLLVGPDELIEAVNTQSEYVSIVVGKIQPGVEKYRDIIIRKISSQVIDFIPHGGQKMTDEVRDEIADLISKFDGNMPVEEQKELLKNLSPDAQRSLRILGNMVKESEGAGRMSDRRLPTDLKWLTERETFKQIFASMRKED